MGAEAEAPPTCVLISDGSVPCREVGDMSKFVRVLQLPPEKHRRSLPRQVGTNLMAAMGAVQQLCSPAASSPAGQVPSQCPLPTANHLPSMSC